MYPVKEIVADEYSNHANKGTLKGLLLFKGTYKIDLSGSYIDSLLPIGDMSLQELDLQNCVFKDPSVLDEYLQYIVNNYGERRNCTIKLTQYPSTAGLMAINTILNEPSWHESGDWVFLIHGIVFLGNVLPYPVPALL